MNLWASLGLVIGWPGIIRGLGRSLARAAVSEALSEVGGVTIARKGSEFVFSGLTKAEARALARAMGLPKAQAVAVDSAISKATLSNVVKVTQNGPDVIVQAFRPGINGYQVFEYVVTPRGLSTVVQKGYDAAGKVVHFHIHK